MREVGSEIELLLHYNRGELPNMSSWNYGSDPEHQHCGEIDLSVYDRSRKHIHLKLCCWYLCVGFRAPLPVRKHVGESKRLRPLGDEVGQRGTPWVYLWRHGDKKYITLMLWCSDSTNPDYIFALRPTSAVLQHHLHGAPPLALPAGAGWRRALHVLGNLPLPQVDLQTVVEQEQGCRREERRQKHLKISDWTITLMFVTAYRWTFPEA